MERKLTTIFAADVVGYSRLMGEDEVGTLKTLKALRKDLVAPLIGQYRGRVIKLMGDGLLAEFGSVVEAVTCAIEIQSGLEQRNYGEEGRERNIQLRIGINLGDVIIEGDDIYGDGVNIAARLEGLAPPGGICISDTVHQHVRSRLDVGFEDLGAQKVKNIAEPIHVYLVEQKISDPRLRGVGKGPAAVPDKPSIAILPFDNMSGDPEQGFFCDGLAEDIITELSRDPDLFVIARNSSFRYKGQSPDIRQVAQDLKVRYVLEGSARRSGNRIRLNAQLIEAETNRHIWAERYDRVIDDIFEIQDELTSTIQNTLLQKVRDTDIEQALRRRPSDMRAYDHLQRALGLLLRVNKEDSETALREAQAALDLDPNYGLAHAVIAWIHLYSVWSGWDPAIKERLQQGYEAAQKAVAADRNSYWGHGAIGFAEVLMRRPDRALAAMNRALALNPNSADVHALRGMVFNFLGRPDEGLADLQKAVEHNPYHPDWYLQGLARSHYMLGRPEAAIPLLEEFTRSKPDAAHGRLLLVAAYAAAGRLEDAKEELSSFLLISPNMTLEHAAAISPVVSAEALERHLELLRTAGLPDK